MNKEEVIKRLKNANSWKEVGVSIKEMLDILQKEGSNNRDAAQLKTENRKLKAEIRQLKGE